jgi:hypothetical protein
MMPYDLKFPEMVEYEFNARFVLEKETPKIYDGEQWGGLWSAFSYPNSRYRGLISVKNIGDLYVARDIESDTKGLDDLQKLNANLNDLKRTTRHELQHFMQNLLGFLTRKKGQMTGDIEWRGMPSKNVSDPEYTPHGKAKNPKDPSKTEMVDEKGRLRHSLRDVEFYTRLSDAIERFNTARRTLPLSLHPLLMKGWIRVLTPEEFKAQLIPALRTETNKAWMSDPRWSSYTPEWQASKLEREINEYSSRVYEPYAAVYREKFFEDLKQYQPEKYRKAVIEFVKAVGL